MGDRALLRVGRGLKEFWPWLLLTVLLTLALPMGITALAVALNGHPVTFVALAGRGEFFLMAIALLGSGMTAMYSTGALRGGWPVLLFTATAVEAAASGMAFGVTLGLIASGKTPDTAVLETTSKATVCLSFFLSSLCIVLAPAVQERG